jgi:hypothetical protein
MEKKRELNAIGVFIKPLPRLENQRWWCILLNALPHPIQARTDMLTHSTDNTSAPARIIHVSCSCSIPLLLKMEILSYYSPYFIWGGEKGQRNPHITALTCPCTEGMNLTRCSRVKKILTFHSSKNMFMYLCPLKS